MKNVFFFLLRYKKLKFWNVYVSLGVDKTIPLYIRWISPQRHARTTFLLYKPRKQITFWLILISFLRYVFVINQWICICTLIYRSPYNWLRIRHTSQGYIYYCKLETSVIGRVLKSVNRIKMYKSKLTFSR